MTNNILKLSGKMKVIKMFSEDEVIRNKVFNTLIHWLTLDSTNMILDRLSLSDMQNFLEFERN